MKSPDQNFDDKWADRRGSPEEIALVDRIKGVFQRYSTVLEYDYPTIELRTGKPALFLVRMSRDPEGEILDHGQIPEERVSIPTYDLVINGDIREGNFNPLDRIVTTYGIIPQLVVAPDKKLYSFYNNYFCNDFGKIRSQVFLRCENGKASLEEVLANRFNLEEKRIAGITRIGKIPRTIAAFGLDKDGCEYGTEFPSLDAFDFERIDTILREIESGNVEGLKLYSEGDEEDNKGRA